MTAARITLLTCLCALAGCQSLERASWDSTENNIQRSVRPLLLHSTDDEDRSTLSAALAEPANIQRLPAVQSSPAVQPSSVQFVAFQEPASDSPLEQQSLEPTVAPPTDSGAPALTIDDLLEMALANNPAVASASARVRALSGKWVQVGLPPNPTIGYSGQEIGVDSTAGQQGGFVGQQFITAGKLGLNQSVVTQEITRAEQELAAVQQRVLTDVRIAFYDVLIAKRQVELARDMVRISDQAVQTSQDLRKVQEFNQVALLQTELQSQDAQILLRKAENEIESSWRRLQSVIASPDLVPQLLSGDLEGADISITWDTALQRLLSDSPEIAAAFAELHRAQWTLRRACAEVTPNVNVQVAVLHDAPTDDVVAGLQVGVPVPILNRNQGAIRQARAEIVAAQRNIERLELELRERLARTFKQYADSRFEVEKYSVEILPKAKQTLDLVTRGYRHGEIGYLDQLTAQRTYFRTNMSYIEALRELWHGTIRIDGLLLQGSLLERSAK